MQITQVTVSYARTESLSNYCNIKPGITLTATLQEGDDPGMVEEDLIETAQTTVHDLIDTAREADGLSPKYYRGKLHRVYRNDDRRCIVVVSNNTQPKTEDNWKYNDYWYAVSVSVRPVRAWEVAIGEAAQHNFALVDCADGDSSKIPALPDAGPAPAWHTKGLARLFKNLRIDESFWDELGQLEHVTADYLQGLYNNDAERGLPSRELRDLIRHNEPWPPAREDKADRDTPEGD